MKTLKEIKDHFSIEEIKLLIEIVKGRQDFDIMETAIRDFYSDEYEPNQKSYDYDKEILIEKLEFDFEMGGIVWGFHNQELVKKS